MRSPLAVALLTALLACQPQALPTPSPTATATPEPTAAATATSRPPTALDLVTIATASWQPRGTTAIVALQNLTDTTFVAVPVDGSPPTTLLEVARSSANAGAVGGWDVRRDGSAVVLALEVGLTTYQLAVVDLLHGTKTWLTRTPQMLVTPRWSYDGTAVYYGSYGSAGDDGVTRVALDGTRATARPPDGPFGGISSVTFETPDRVLVGADEFNGPTTWIRDLATGRERSFGVHYSTVVAWRAARPRALVTAITNIAQPGAGYVATWDDIDGTTRTLWSEPTRGADFEPGGDRVVVATTSPNSSGRLLIIGRPPGNISPLAGTEGATSPRWLSEGILYTVFTPPQGSELRSISATGAAGRTLLVSAGQMTRVVAVR